MGWILERLMPWRKYLRAVKQSQEETSLAVEKSKKLQDETITKVIQEERLKTAKTILAARRAIRAAKRITENGK